MAADIKEPAHRNRERHGVALAAVFFAFVPLAFSEEIVEAAFSSSGRGGSILAGLLGSALYVLALLVMPLTIVRDAGAEAGVDWARFLALIPLLAGTLAAYIGFPATSRHHRDRRHPVSCRSARHFRPAAAESGMWSCAFGLARVHGVRRHAGGVRRRAVHAHLGAGDDNAREHRAARQRGC